MQAIFYPFYTYENMTKESNYKQELNNIKDCILTDGHIARVKIDTFSFHGDVEKTQRITLDKESAKHLV